MLVDLNFWLIKITDFPKSCFLIKDTFFWEMIQRDQLFTQR